MTGVIFAIIGLALGGILKGATGAGAPIVAVPVMTMYFGVPIAVTMFAAPNLLANVWQAWAHRKEQLPLPFMLMFAGGGANKPQKILWGETVKDPLSGRLRLSETESLEASMHDQLHHCEDQSTIRTNLGAVFASIELSRSTWIITSLSPGGWENVKAFRALR